MLTNQVFEAASFARRIERCLARDVSFRFLAIWIALCLPAGALGQNTTAATATPKGALAAVSAMPEVNAPAPADSLAAVWPGRPVAPDALSYSSLWASSSAVLQSEPKPDADSGLTKDGDSAPRAEKPAKAPVESEIILEAMASYGNYQIFAAGTDSKVYYGGVEYNRHTWGKFLGARFDYVAEILPIVMLNQPAVTDYWGNPKSKERKYVPGVGITPIGFRWLWRPKKQWRPYLEAKGGIVGFTSKALSQAATYENFTLQSCMGVQVMMTDRIGLRLGLFGDFHFSNSFITQYNPGLDVMNANLGVSWHFHDH